jgi:predicted RNA methylase
MVTLMKEIFSHPIFDGMIDVRHADAFTSVDPSVHRCVTNPPYGKRIDRSRSFSSLISWFDTARFRGALVYGGDDDGYTSPSHGHTNITHRSANHYRHLH